MEFTTHWSMGITACIWNPDSVFGMRNGVTLISKKQNIKVATCVIHKVEDGEVRGGREEEKKRGE